jgi:Flp pilus assembly protein protease CpaA
LAFVWIAFAVIQDLRTREISNWLNFSLVAFALAYRAFYSAEVGSWNFFLWGLGGFALFWILACSLYYARAFAGGDAKLLIGLGIILPFSSYSDYALFGFIFLLLLFALGALYSLVYTGFLAFSYRKAFSRALKKQLTILRYGFIIWTILSICVGLGIFILFKSFYSSLLVASFVWIGLLLFAYTRAVEQACFIRKVVADQLTEGDWLVSDVNVGGKVVQKTVHGLTRKDILLLKKYKKEVLIRYGVPFGPAFLFALIAFLVVIYRYPVFLRSLGFG